MPELKIDWDNVGLGTKPDAKIADELGCSQAAVSKNRRRRGIKPFRNYPGKRKARSLTSHIDWDQIGLGTRYDRIIAEDLGIDPQIVRRERAKRGIKPFRSTRT